ncbi:MAG TPA: hypothetical protein VFA71_10665 [Terriglobales bacterium]|nr:hypothetical protein [Terriglobales bacterium]
MPKKMSKGFYIGGYIIGLVISIIFTIVIVVADIWFVAQHPDDPPLLLLVGLAALCIIPLAFSLTIFFMFIYRMWAAIQDSYVRMTPGKAVGFLLIPVFNFYWLFHVFHGFAYDYNEYVKRRKLNLPQLDEQLFRYYPIAVLCLLVPFVGTLAWPVGLVLLVIIMSKTCDAINALSAVQQAAPATDATPA